MLEGSRANSALELKHVCVWKCRFYTAFARVERMCHRLVHQAALERWDGDIATELFIHTATVARNFTGERMAEAPDCSLGVNAL